MPDEPVGVVIDFQHAFRFVDDDLRGGKLLGRDAQPFERAVPAARVVPRLRDSDIGDVRNAKGPPRADQRRRAVQRDQRLGRRMKPLGKRFGQVAIAERGQFGLIGGVFRKGRNERPLREARGDDDHPRRGDVAPLLQRLFGRRVELPIFFEPARFLEAAQRGDIGRPFLPVDHAGREAEMVEQNLRAKRRRRGEGRRLGLGILESQAVGVGRDCLFLVGIRILGG